MSEYGESIPEDFPAVQSPTAKGDLARRATSHAPGLTTGTGLGKYRILERIRTYHNAVVYKARDMMLDRLVALKQMSPDLMDNPTACGNFKKEAQLLARVPKDARHVLNVHELIEDEIGLFIVEEYIHGDWLESLIAKRRVSADDAYRLLRTACIGLRDLHTQKIVHRDINPGNIIVTKGAQAKIANFYSAAQEGDIATPPVITPKYSAPELLLEGTYDDRLDIYALGMVAYEVCAGRPAMERVFAEIINSKIPVEGWIRWHTDFKRALPDPATLNPLVSAGLASVIRQMTAKRLEERYTCVEEVLAALARHARPPTRQQSGRKLPAPLPSPASDRIPASPPRPSRGDANRAFEDFLASSRRLQTRTSTYTVRPAAERASPQPMPRQAATAPRRPTGFGVRSESRRAPRVIPPAMPIPLPASILPRAARKPLRRRRRSVISRAMAAIILIAVGAVGTYGLTEYIRRTPPHPIDGIFLHAIEAYDLDKLDEAQKLFTEASHQDVRYAQHQLKRAEAERWLLMVQAKAALERDDFDNAQRFLQQVERQGDISPSKRNQLQQKIWSKQDAYRAAAKGFDDIRAGNFQGAEMRLDEYEKNAARSGLDPNALKDKLSGSRKQKEYHEWLKTAEESLTRKEFDKAFTACNAAESYLITSDTRDLRKRIGDAQRQVDHVDRGNRAMASEDYSEALSAYEEAGRIFATPEIEAKSRAAKARLLLRDAKEAIANGDLLSGEDKLKSSIWNSPLFEAQAKLEKMQPAFDAARLVRNGDQALDIENFDEAIRIYEQAKTRLPEPAASQVSKKLDEARRRQAVIRGEKAFKREAWLEAISALEEAQKLGHRAEVEDMLIRAKAHLP